MLHHAFFKKLSIRQRFVIGVVLIGIVLFVGFIAFDTFFHVREVQMVRKSDSRATDADLRALKGLDSWRGHNIIFLNPEKVTRTIYDNNPSVKDVSVEKKYPSTLLIAARFYQPFVYFAVNNGYFTLSDSGRILAKSREKRAGLPLVSYYQKLNYASYEAGDSIDYEDVSASLHFLSHALDLGFKINNIDIKGPDMLALYAQDKRLVFTTEKERDLQDYQLGVLTRQFKIEGKDFTVMDFRFDKPVIELKIAR